MTLPQDVGQITESKASCFGHSVTGKGQQGVPRSVRAAGCIGCDCCVREQRLDHRLVLSSRGPQVQAQDMQDSEERPNLCSRSWSSLNLADYFSDLFAIANGCCGDKSVRCKSVFEFGSVMSHAG